MKEKDILSSEFEVEELEQDFKELENVDDLWYNIKANSAAWIACSTGE